jgi:hypothetical protein
MNDRKVVETHVVPIFNKYIKIILSKCFPDICTFYQKKYKIKSKHKKEFNDFVKKCFYYRFGLGPLPPPQLSLDDLLEEIAFGGLSLTYEIKNKFFQLAEFYGLNANSEIEYLLMQYF